ncbi:MAG: hypothetical protein ACJ748_01260 [Flavisolibacter sp.]
MKYKTRLEMKVSKNKDPFNTIEKIKKLPGVLSASVVDFNTVVVQYDCRKISEKELKQSA